MKKFAKNNHGFSLVEILIAMAIFVLCAAPFLRSLVLSIQTNAKSREILNATTVAENIIEDIKADGVVVYLGLDQADGGVSPSGTNTYGNIYTTGYDHYLLDGKNYKVSITLSASDKTPASSAIAYNSARLAELYRMNTMTDAIYVQPETEASEAVIAYVNNPSAPDYMQAPSNILAGLVTNYEFDISCSNSIYEVNQTLCYQTASGSEVQERTIPVYSSVNNGSDLQRVYIFFTPSVKNHIIINNTDEVPLELYLVKQTDAACSIDLTIREGMVHAGSAADPVCTKVRTNVEAADWSSLFYNSTGLSYTAMQAKFGMHALDKTEEEADTRIYEIEVEVDDMDGTKITSLSGTALQ